MFRLGAPNDPRFVGCRWMPFWRLDDSRKLWTNFFYLSALLQATSELAATYAALILADEGVEITVRFLSR
jgi:hypothetical protein